MRRDRDDDDDDDDRPRRKKRRDDDRPRRSKRATKPGSPLGLILGIVGGGVALLLLVAVGAGVFFAMRRPPANANRPVVVGGITPAPGPAVGGQVTGSRTVWVNYRQADGLYSVKIPTTQLIPGSDMSKLNPHGNEQISSMTSASQEVNCFVIVKVLSPDSLAREQKAVQEVGPNKRQVNWLGRTVIEESDPNGLFAGVTRRFLDGNRRFEFRLSGFPRKPTDEEYALFFDSVVIGGGR